MANLLSKGAKFDLNFYCEQRAKVFSANSERTKDISERISQKAKEATQIFLTSTEHQWHPEVEVRRLREGQKCWLEDKNGRRQTSS